MPLYFQLDEFYLTALQLNFVPYQDGVPRKVQSNIDYDIKSFNNNELQFRMDFKVGVREFKENLEPAGMSLDCIMVGFFTISEELEAEKREVTARVNGVQMLYGALRGIVMNLTATLPGGKRLLPGIDPVDAVNFIESEKARKNQQAPDPQASKEKTAPVKKRVRKVSRVRR